MPVNTTPMKFGGLLVALGLFGMGPGTILMEELRAKFSSYRNKEQRSITDDDESSSSKNDQTTSDVRLERRTTTYREFHPEAEDFLKHPFQPAAANLTRKQTPKTSHPTPGGGGHDDNKNIPTNDPTAWSISFLWWFPVFGVGSPPSSKA